MVARWLLDGARGWLLESARWLLDDARGRMPDGA